VLVEIKTYKGQDKLNRFNVVVNGVSELYACNNDAYEQRKVIRKICRRVEKTLLLNVAGLDKNLI